jgi:DNA-binding CsgD family transcriptional regulator
MFDSDVYARLLIESPDQIRPAAIRLRDTVRDFTGLRTAVCHDVSDKAPMCDGDGEVLASSVFGFTSAQDQWWLSACLALRSPLIAACRFEAEPFWCNGAGYFTRQKNELLGTLDLHDFAGRAMTQAAIVVPVHLPFGQMAAASFLSPDAAATDLSGPFEKFADMLGLYARRFIVSYLKVTQASVRTVPDPSLRKREVECLRWAALGKTNDEIADIMHLSRGTIRFHIRNASQRLRTVNRDQTLCRAAQLNYLGRLA